MRRRPQSLAGALAAATLAAAAHAPAQTIRIPDIRELDAPVAAKIAGPCGECGRVVSIREIATERTAAVPATFQGAARGPVQHNLVGAVVYLPLSSASSDRPFVGGVGTPEMRERFGNTTYELTLRMDDGSVRFVQRGDAWRYRVGDRVRAAGADGLELVAG